MKQFRRSPIKLILPPKSCLRKKEWHSKHRRKSWLIWFPDKIQNTRGRKTDDYKFGDKRALQQDWTHSGSSVEDYRALSNFILSEVSPPSSRQETVRKPSMLVEKKLTYNCSDVRLQKYINWNEKDWKVEIQGKLEMWSAPNITVSFFRNGAKERIILKHNSNTLKIFIFSNSLSILEWEILPQTQLLKQFALPC